MESPCPSISGKRAEAFAHRGEPALVERVDRIVQGAQQPPVQGGHDVDRVMVADAVSDGRLGGHGRVIDLVFLQGDLVEHAQIVQDFPREFVARKQGRLAQPAALGIEPRGGRMPDGTLEAEAFDVDLFRFRGQHAVAVRHISKP